MASRLKHISAGLVWMTALVLFIQPLAADFSCLSCKAGHQGKQSCSCVDCEHAHSKSGCRHRHSVCHRSGNSHSAHDGLTKTPWRSCPCPASCPCQLRKAASGMLTESRGYEPRTEELLAAFATPAETISFGADIAERRIADLRTSGKAASELCAVFCRFTI